MTKLDTASRRGHCDATLTEVQSTRITHHTLYIHTKREWSQL